MKNNLIWEQKEEFYNADFLDYSYLDKGSKAIKKWLRNSKPLKRLCNFFKREPHKMVKHTQTIRWLLKTNCLSLCDHFMGLALKGLGKLEI